MKKHLNKFLSISAKILILIFSIINLKPNYLNAEDSYFNEMEIDSSTKSDTSESGLPSNPFELVEMIRRANSMNEATKPSVAIDDALKLFNKIEENENL